MRKLIALAASALAFAAPALAAPVTLEFVTVDGGDPVVVTLLDNGTYVLPDETTGNYSVNGDRDRICGIFDGANLCVDFAVPLDEFVLGEPVDFTTNSDDEGTATLIFAAAAE